MTGRSGLWFTAALALGSALIIAFVAYLDTRQLPLPEQPAPLYAGPTTSTATLLTVSGGDQPTFGTSGNNNLVLSSSWTSKTYITIGPWDTSGTEPVKPPTWLEFHDTLPDSFTIRVQGGEAWTLGELRRPR